MTHNAPLPLTSSGSAVVLEPESPWPTKAFAANADCECVVILPVDPSLSISHLVERIATRSAQFERVGAKLRTVILACAGCDRKRNDRRLLLVRALLPLLPFREGRLVLTSNPNKGPTTDELFELAGALLSELQQRSITLFANDWEVVTPTPRKQSGVFLANPGTFRGLDPTTSIQDAELLEAVGEAV